MLERGHTEAVFKWQLSHTCKYLLTVHRCLGEATREGQTDLCGSVGEASIHQQERSSPPRVGHVQEVKPDGTSWGSESWVGAGWFLREGSGVQEAPWSPRVLEGGIRHMELSSTCPGLRFPGSVPPCRLAALGAACPLVEQVSPPSLSGLGLWNESLRPGRTDGAAL